MHRPDAHRHEDHHDAADAPKQRGVCAHGPHASDQPSAGERDEQERDDRTDGEGERDDTDMRLTVCAPRSRSSPPGPVRRTG